MRTITHEVRSFLRQEGAQLAPWSGLDATYAELYALLYRRRRDPTFWEPLERLLSELIERSVEPGSSARLSLPQAELLTSWDTKELVATLRSALPDAPEGQLPELESYTRKMSLAVLGGFLLLGLAASGCSGATEEGPGTGGTSSGGANTGGTSTGGVAVTGGVPGSGGATGGAAVCTLASSEVIASTINDAAAFGDTEKENLCECLARLNLSWTGGLEELFRSGTPEQISAVLYELMDCCVYEPGEFQRDYASIEAALLTRNLCEPVVIYKGVSFPDE